MTQYYESLPKEKELIQKDLIGYFEKTNEIKKLKKVYEYLLAYHIGDKKHMEKLEVIVNMEEIKPLAN